MGWKRLTHLCSSNKTYTLQLKEKAKHSSFRETMQLRPRSRLMCRAIHRSPMCIWPWNRQFNQHKLASFGKITAFGLRPRQFTTVRLVMMECSLETEVEPFGISTPVCKGGPFQRRTMLDSILQTAVKMAPLETRSRLRQVPHLNMQRRPP